MKTFYRIVGILFLSNQAQAVWNISVLDSAGDVGQYCSAGNIGYYIPVSYYDATNGNLKYLILEDLSISKGPYQVDTTGNVGGYISTAINYDHSSPDTAWISYYDFTNKNLKCACIIICPPGDTCKTNPIDTLGDVGMYTSVCLDTFQRPNISYYDATNGNLKYAKWNGTQWVIEKVDTAGDVGMCTSLRIDDSNHPHITYYDDTNKDLKYAVWSGTKWNIEKIDTTGDIGKNNSLNYDDYSDNYYVSYYDETNGNLKYAIGGTKSSWSIYTIDTTGDVGLFSSVSSDGGVVCYDKTNGDLKGIDTIGNVGQYCNYEHGGDRGWVFYYDSTNGNLKCAWENTATEEKEISRKSILSVSPNPTTCEVKVTCARKNGEISHLRLYNIAGKKIRQFDFRNEFNGVLSDLTPGCYFLRLTSGEYKENIKLIILK
ncbi:MAG: T9SS type A sorting domain-containing protein [bacterium]|nr:T9SS type A sorting domain-containing protein [bacterium]